MSETIINSFKRVLPPARLKVLTKCVIVGSVSFGIYSYVTRYFFERRIRQTVTYKRALEIFHNHEEAVKHLGKPIQEGRIGFDRAKAIKKFTVDLNGANTKGKLDCEYTVLSDLKTEIRKLQLKLNNVPDQIIIHEIR